MISTVDKPDLAVDNCYYMIYIPKKYEIPKLSRTDKDAGMGMFFFPSAEGKRMLNHWMLGPLGAPSF